MIDDVIARLAAMATPPWTRVEGAEELAAIAEGVAPAHGTVFVIPLDEDARPNELATGFRQRSEVVFVVACVIRQHGPATGASRVSQIEVIRAALIGALAGWQWAPDSIPVEFLGARAQPAKNNVLWYVTTWRTDRTIRSVS